MENKGVEASLKMETRENPYGSSTAKASVDGGGVTAPLNMTPVSPSSVWQSRGGTIDMMTTAASLDKTPRKGWNGSPNEAQMSKRARTASK